MSTALIMSRAQLGLTAPAVSVEVHLPTGLPGFTTSGFTAGDARERIKSAIINSRFTYPKGRIVVNLGPAELPKAGGRFDLAIATGILAASGQLPWKLLSRYDLIGELSLFGDVRTVRGTLTAARETAADQRLLIAPMGNGTELQNVAKGSVRLIRHLDQLATIEALVEPPSKSVTVARLRQRQFPKTSLQPNSQQALAEVDPLHDVIGQHRAKRALTIAAAGGHHMLMIGPPGSGKTMLAERLSQLLPSVAPAAGREIAEIYSACGLQLLPPGKAPFRAPHHGASAPALTGGGSPPQPGEVSLAHNGVLFLDELPEFRRDALEALREPLEAGSIRISRRAGSAEFPARFQLIAAMNPCPIGLVCTPTNCRCSPEQAERYRNRISAPILDRIDLHISVHTVPIASLLNARAEPKDSNICERIKTARSHQLTRGERLNAHLDMQQTKAHCDCDAQTLAFLGEAAQRLQLSARVFYRTLRVARTIADLADQPAITRDGVEEALSYRPIAPQ